MTSSTDKLPRHIAIIMDGNGRWARARLLPRHVGHHAGVRTVRAVVERCTQLGIEVLTLFAFSSENWRRPKEEVSRLMQLFLDAMDREIAALHENSIKVRFIGDVSSLEVALQQRIAAAQTLTAANTRMTLVIAVAYGGRWDILQATRRVVAECVAGRLHIDHLDEGQFATYLSSVNLPEPDLFIRTGGERRISNFLLWQLAYAELYFCDTLWPDFGEQQLTAALDYFQQRQRRYGLTPEQLPTA